MQHSSIVGGSTAKRVINCPGSVQLSLTAPPKPSSRDADKGSLLHNVIAAHLESNEPLESFVGTSYGSIVLTEDMIEEKLRFALAALEEIDPFGVMEFVVERRVAFDQYLPGVFGSCDLLGRIANKAIVLDWKFGDGVMVDVEENEQLMFYAAAGMRTPGLEWVFDGATEIECVIVQPPYIKRWTTTPARIKQFEAQLKLAVREAAQPTATMASGEWCRWCPAKPTCPVVTGEAQRALRAAVKQMNPQDIGEWLAKADLLEGWIEELRATALTMLNEGANVPGYKLVAKRGTRKWANEQQALVALRDLGLKESELYEVELKSPAKVEKLLKKQKQAMPDNLVVSVSSGNTLASEADPRPPVLLIGQHLAALSKLQ